MTLAPKYAFELFSTSHSTAFVGISNPSYSFQIALLKSIWLHFVIAIINPSEYAKNDLENIISVFLLTSGIKGYLVENIFRLILTYRSLLLVERH